MQRQDPLRPDRWWSASVLPLDHGQDRRAPERYVEADRVYRIRAGEPVDAYFSPRDKRVILYDPSGKGAPLGDVCITPLTIRGYRCKSAMQAHKVLRALYLSKDALIPPILKSRSNRRAEELTYSEGLVDVQRIDFRNFKRRDLCAAVEILYAKAMQNPSVLLHLMGTGNKYLAYAADDDEQWGVGPRYNIEIGDWLIGGNGPAYANAHGVTWMSLRDEFRTRLAAIVQPVVPGHHDREVVPYNARAARKNLLIGMTLALTRSPLPLCKECAERRYFDEPELKEAQQARKLETAFESQNGIYIGGLGPGAAEKLEPRIPRESFTEDLQRQGSTESIVRWYRRKVSNDVARRIGLKNGFKDGPELTKLAEAMYERERNKPDRRRLRPASGLSKYPFRLEKAYWSEDSDPEGEMCARDLLARIQEKEETAIDERSLSRGSRERGEKAAAPRWEPETDPEGTACPGTPEAPTGTPPRNVPHAENDAPRPPRKGVLSRTSTGPRSDSPVSKRARSEMDLRPYRPGNQDSRSASRLGTAPTTFKAPKPDGQAKRVNRRRRGRRNRHRERPEPHGPQLSLGDPVVSDRGGNLPRPWSRTFSV